MRPLVLLLFAATLAHAAVAPEKLDQVRGLIRERKLTEAEIAARALINAHPREAEAHALLGSVLFAKADPEPAVKAYEKAVELSPANGELRRLLGDAYGFAAQKASVLFKMSWGKKCRLAYEKAVELDSANLNARSSLMMFYQLAPGIAGGSMEKAYEQAAAIKQHDANRGRVAYAMLYAGEKKYAEAFTELDEALKATPDHYAALYQLGRLAAMTGERTDRGIEALRKCLTIPAPAGSPGHDAAHWRLGNLWEKKGDKPAARTAYQAALALNPAHAQAAEALKKLN